MTILIIGQYGVRSIMSMIIAAIIITAQMGCASTIYYIYGQPTWEESREIPFPTTIYRIDDNNGNLEQIWSNSSHKIYTNSILIFEKEALIIVVEGLSFPNKYNIIFMSDPSTSRFVEIEKCNKYFMRHIFKDKDENRFIEFYSFTDSKDLITNSYDLITGAKIANKDIDKTLLLSGVTTLETPNSDIVAAVINENGEVIFRGNINLQLPKIPENVIKKEHESDWNLISNEENYSALYSIPSNINEVSRLLLVYNKKMNIWNKYNISGSSTRLRNVNGWFAGTIANKDPRTNFETLEGYPPILTEKAIIIEPIKGSQYTFHLGDSCEILYIQGNDIYYRLNDSLYKAKINNNDLAEKQLLLTDERIKHIHWAFKGKETLEETRSKTID